MSSITRSMHFEPRFELRLRSLALFALALAACGGDAEGPARRGSGPERRVVQVARPTPVAWPRTVELGGTLEAPERVQIAARIEGAVVSLEVDLGDSVRRGQTLARITPEDFAARVAQTDAELAQARSERERLEQLAGRDLASAEQLEQARTRERVLAAQRRLAGRQLRDTRVVAPFDGAIAARHVSPGAFVRVGAPLFDLVATSPLRLALDVPERHAREVRVGTEVTVHHEGGEPIVARVARVAPVVDAATRTFRVLVDVPVGESEAALRPGMYVRASVALGVVRDAVSVPRAAVFEVLGRSRVVEVVDGRAQPRDVELVGEGEGTAIVRGLSGAHDVVTRSPGLLAPGTEVAPAPADDVAR
ncbi:MAG TPA: efflux RND transporter periplasmic adaptor subunit, partial [Sandaracinaceae bacterium]